MANGKPHVHKIEVRRAYDAINRGCYQVVYGDTTVNVGGERYTTDCKVWPGHRKWDKKLRKAVELAIHRHDAGSKRVENLQAQIAKLNSEFALSTSPNRWASEGR